MSYKYMIDIYICHIYDRHTYAIYVYDFCFTLYIVRLSEIFLPNMKFRVQFTINRLSIKLEHRAVSWAGEIGPTGLESVLFPSYTNLLPPFRSPDTLRLR